MENQKLESNATTRPVTAASEETVRQSEAVGSLDLETLERLKTNPDRVLADALSESRHRLWQLVQFRMHSRLAARVDADDVLQEAFLAAHQRIDHFIKQPKSSLFVWLRLIVMQTLVDIHRRHFGAEQRSVHRERLLGGVSYLQTTSACLAQQISAGHTSPSGVAIREESASQLEAAIAEMSELDQEVIAMRHFEGLSNSETAQALGLTITAASNRYVRALAKLKVILDSWDNLDRRETP